MIYRGESILPHDEQKHWEGQNPCVSLDTTRTEVSYNLTNLVSQLKSVQFPIDKV
jgi:hypothetical protein